MDLSLIVACALIALMGLPHGALDPFVAYRSGLIKDLLSALRFVLLYLGVMLIIIASWLLLPKLTLIAFLLLSGFHFGRDWRGIIDWNGFGYGALIVGLPALMQADQVTQIFSFLLFGAAATLPVGALQIVGAVGAILLLSNLRRINLRQRVEIMTLVTASFLLSPLWYFVSYFCLLHSPRHLMDEISKIPLQQRKKVYFVVVVTTLITLGMFAITALALWNKIPDINAFIYQLLFIGMAALTVPHMFLLEWADRRKC